MPLKNTLWSLDTGKMKAETAESGVCMNRDERTTYGGPRFSTMCGPTCDGSSCIMMTML